MSLLPHISDNHRCSPCSCCPPRHRSHSEAAFRGVSLSVSLHEQIAEEPARPSPGLQCCQESHFLRLLALLCVAPFLLRLSPPGSKTTTSPGGVLTMSHPSEGRDLFPSKHPPGRPLIELTCNHAAICLDLGPVPMPGGGGAAPHDSHRPSIWEWKYKQRLLGCHS